MRKPKFIVYMFILLVSNIPAILLVNAFNFNLFTVFVIGLASGVISLLIANLYARF